MSDCLTDTKVETHQCPSHQSILLTHGPIHEIFTKKTLRIGDFEKLVFFESAILEFFFLNGSLKKGHFPAPSILNIFLRKFHGLVVGLVELIDAKGIDVAQPIWL